MADMTAILGLVSSLKAAGEITKAMIVLRDAEVFRGKAIELQGVILSAQESALSANLAQFALVDQVRALERKIADLEAWEAEKQRYELKELYRGSLAYATKEAVRGSEPFHYICPNCYQTAVKSILQGHEQAFGGRMLTCPRCKLEITHSYNPDWRPAM